MKYQDVVEYNGRQLFSGAIDIDDFLSQPEKAKEIASCYIFHGKSKHAGVNGGHILTDSISFIERILEALESDNPEMLLGIAGYGVGKSHLGLTISTFLSSRNASDQEAFFQKISDIDAEASQRIHNHISKDDKPFLVVPLNGMRNVNLKDLFFSTIKRILLRDGVETSCLDSFDPRFEALKEVVLNHQNQSLVKRLLIGEGLSYSSFESAMDSMNQDVYERVTKAILDAGIKYFEPAAIGELKDIISAVAEALCGRGKPYRAMLIVFDEFGKYMAYAAANEGSAGPGCMQLLFEGIQSNSGMDGHIVLLGLSQLDLREYQMGSGDLAFTNTMSRYVTRFEPATRYYLSACFETLVANLIHVKDSACLRPLTSLEGERNIQMVYKTLTSSFRQISSNDLWGNLQKYRQVIIQGCWPLSPYLMWALSYITSVNNLLQQRSGFNLLSTLFSRYIYPRKYEEGDLMTIPAIQLFDAGLLAEFLNSERNFQTSDPIATEYQFFMQKYENKLSEDENSILKAIVLAHKLSANCSSMYEMNYLLKEFSGLNINQVRDALGSLSNVYNAVNYNQAMGQYEIHSDSISVTQFETVIKQRARDYMLQRSKSEQFDCVNDLFSYSTDVYSIKEASFSTVFCDFAEEHDISTSEWCYSPSTIIGYNYLSNLERGLNTSDLLSFINYDEPKGKIFYVILPRELQLQNVKDGIKSLLDKKTAELGYTVPAMVLLLQDKNDSILEASIEMYVLSHLTKEDQQKYLTLISRKKEQLLQKLSDAIEIEISEKNYVYPEGISLKRPLRMAGRDIFEKIYPNVIPYYIDGKNWLPSVERIIQVLGKGNIFWNDIMNLSDPKLINRAKHLFMNLWEVVDEKGRFCRYPKQEVLNELFADFDEQLESGLDLSVINCYQKLLKAPFGANSTGATTVIVYYLSTRDSEIDFIKNSEVLTLSGLLSAKGSLSKYKSFSKIWDNVVFRRAIRNDAKWVNLVNRWVEETDAINLIELENDAIALQNQKISVPSHLTTTIASCMERSKAAEDLVNEWVSNCDRIKNEIDEDLNKERIGKPLTLYCDNYLKLYNRTIGNGKIKVPPILMPKEIEENEAIFQKSVLEYFDSNVDRWMSEHPFTYDAPFTEYNEMSAKYTNFANNLALAGLQLVANDVKAEIEECQDRRRCFTEFAKTKNQISSEYRNVKQSIENGLYASAQVLSFKNQLNRMLKIISDFDPQKLEKISGYNFDSLRQEINTTAAFVDDYGKKKDEEFNSLFDADISRVEDLDHVIEVSSDLVVFYRGMGVVKNNNLEDAECLKKEATELRRIYNLMKNERLSVQELLDLVETEKARLYETLDGDSIYDDDAILDEFADEFRKEIEARSQNWLKSQEKSLYACKSTNEINRVIYAMDSAPNYTKGSINQGLDDLRSYARSKLSTMKMDYIKELFEELTEKDKDEFRAWCKK